MMLMMRMVMGPVVRMMMVVPMMILRQGGLGEQRKGEEGEKKLFHMMIFLGLIFTTGLILPITCIIP